MNRPSLVGKTHLPKNKLFQNFECSEKQPIQNLMVGCAKSAAKVDKQTLRGQRCKEKHQSMYLKINYLKKRILIDCAKYLRKTL
jgi:hypothetical protein